MVQNQADLNIWDWSLPYSVSKHKPQVGHIKIHAMPQACNKELDTYQSLTSYLYIKWSQCDLVPYVNIKQIFVVAKRPHLKTKEFILFSSKYSFLSFTTIQYSPTWKFFETQIMLFKMTEILTI